MMRIGMMLMSVEAIAALTCLTAYIDNETPIKVAKKASPTTAFQA